MLLELTSLPTAAGHEDRVIAWVERWASRRKWIELKRDRFGNLMLQRKGTRGRKPIVLAAHMDHPAFVVTVIAGLQVGAEFRGGVKPKFFEGARVRLFHENNPPQFGRIVSVTESTQPDSGPSVVAQFKENPQARPGDVMTWDLDPACIEDGRLFAPACDDLAGVAAGLLAFEQLLRSKAQPPPDVRVLLTRAEEVGFIGAMAACRSGIIPRQARIIAIENSRSYAESPIGGGPIVRVGDRTSTFDPDLTYGVGKIAEKLTTQRTSFAWQRRLMPGGTCEASAYQTLGYKATCVCLPLGNYHNMNDTAMRIDSETISLTDFAGLVRLLVAVGRQLDEPTQSPSLRSRLDDLFDQRKHLLD